MTTEQKRSSLSHHEIQGFRTTFDPWLPYEAAEQNLAIFEDDLEYMSGEDLLDDLEIYIRSNHDDANRNQVYIKLVRQEILKRMK